MQIVVNSLTTYQGYEYADLYGEQLLKIDQVQGERVRCRLADGSLSEWIPSQDLRPIGLENSDSGVHNPEDDFSWDPPLDAPICYGIE